MKVKELSLFLLIICLLGGHLIRSPRQISDSVQIKDPKEIAADLTTPIVSEETNSPAGEKPEKKEAEKPSDNPQDVKTEEPSKEPEEEPVTEKSPEEPVTEKSPKEPEEEPVTEKSPEEPEEEPVTEKSPEEPVTETSPEEPDVEKPGTEKSPEEPVTEKSPEEPETETSLEEPEVEKPGTEKSPEEPEEEPVTEKSPEEPVTETSPEEPETETSPKEPEVEKPGTEKSPKEPEEEPEVEKSKTEKSPEEPEEEPVTEKSPEEPEEKLETEKSPEEPEVEKSGTEKSPVESEEKPETEDIASEKPETEDLVSEKPQEEEIQPENLDEATGDSKQEDISEKEDLNTQETPTTTSSDEIKENQDPNSEKPREEPEEAISEKVLEDSEKPSTDYDETNQDIVTEEAIMPEPLDDQNPESEVIKTPNESELSTSTTTEHNHGTHGDADCPKKGLWFNEEEPVEETTTEIITSTQVYQHDEFYEHEESLEKVPRQNSCIYDEMKPLKYTCLGEPICSYLACCSLLLMMIFNLAKNIRFYGCRKLFDLRLNGTSFPKRPELIVIICSTLPLIFVSLIRPVFPKLNFHHEIFIFHAGAPQIRAFFDYFSRSATLYHMIYWAYRMPIINLIWKIFMFTRLKIIAFKERKNDEMQFSSKKFRRGRRRRKKRKNGVPGQLRQQKIKPTRAPTGITAAGVKPNTRPTGRRRHKKTRKNQKQTRNNQQMSPSDLYNFGGQNFWNNMGNSGMIMEGGPMGGMNMGNFGGGMLMGGDASLFMNDFFDMEHGEGNADEEKALEDEIIIPEITREFIILCKRIIPGVIYGFSFLVNLPVLADFKQEWVTYDNYTFLMSKPKEHIRRFLIYDIVFLMGIPMVAILIAFFYGILKDVQLNGETKMRYSLKCYYVTFIVLNLPIFILYLAYLNMDIEPGYKFGTCLILALTVYHANFILKSTIHGTACNMICCSDKFFKSHTKLKKWLDDMTTPILVKQRRANEKMVDFKR